MKRQALGKGLSSLIPEPILEAPEAGMLMLDIHRIQPNTFQPRSDFSGLEGLVTSIRENGVVQPVVVRQEADGYRLIAGERRWRAAQMAGMTRIPAVVRKIEDDRLLEVALIENIQRKELNPIEEAKAYLVLLERMRLSQSEIARKVGRERSSIANSLRLLKLPAKVMRLVQEGALSFGHAKAIMALSDPGMQIKVADETVRLLLSVRETEARAAALAGKPGKGAAAKKTAAAAATARDPNVAAAEQKLTRSLATKVRIAGNGERGRIEIEYYSAGELDRLYEFLMTADKGH